MESVNQDGNHLHAGLGPGVRLFDSAMESVGEDGNTPSIRVPSAAVWVPQWSPSVKRKTRPPGRVMIRDLTRPQWSLSTTKNTLADLSFTTCAHFSLVPREVGDPVE